MSNKNSKLPIPKSPENMKRILKQIKSIQFQDYEQDDKDYVNIYIFKKKDWKNIQDLIGSIKFRNIDAVMTAKSSNQFILDHPIGVINYDTNAFATSSKNIEEEILNKTALGRDSYLKFTRSPSGQNSFEPNNNSVPASGNNTVFFAFETQQPHKNKQKTGGKIRKHKGIIQTGGNAGKLRKGYKYSGKFLKNGKPQIIKI